MENTPEQYRGIADEIAGNPTTHSLQEGIAALRAAADRIEWLELVHADGVYQADEANEQRLNPDALGSELLTSESRVTLHERAQMLRMVARFPRSDDALTIERGAGALDVAADVVDRLRAVIENAPHRFNCQKRMTGVHLRSQGQADNCTCWKAEAL